MTDFEKFTKGPWKAHSGAMEPDFVYYGSEEKCDEENRVVCECFLRPKRHARSADVYLIAAAPKMYELLKRIKTMLEWCELEQSIDEETEHEISALLAEARGENEDE